MAKTKTLPTFEVDKEGLRRVLARKGMGWILPELIQNAWDEDATTVDVDIAWVGEVPTKRSQQGIVKITVEDDDPNGFTDLTHAYTLFAESEKKSSAELRGRFNVGEKLVVAAAETAVIETTTGTVTFGPEGRIMSPAKRGRGSRFVGHFRMTPADFDEAIRVVESMLPPADVKTYLSGQLLSPRKPLRTWQDILPTEIGPELKRTTRKTTVEVYEPLDGETPMLYELGIPVVATKDQWHVNIGQKVPLNVDRDNVTPAYKQDVRRSVVNHCHDLIHGDAAAEQWTTDALEDEKIEPAALGAVLDERFGVKRVAFDPSDLEANKIAASEGYTVVPSRTLPKTVWTKVRENDLIPRAGAVTPSPKPYNPGEAETRAELPRDQWTHGMVRIANLAVDIAKRLLDVEPSIAIVNDPACRNFAATYRRGLGRQLEFNLGVLGRKWFEEPISAKHVSLIIHELGHERESDHLSRSYYDTLTDLGAELAFAVAADPEWWAAATAGILVTA